MGQRIFWVWVMIVFYPVFTQAASIYPIEADTEQAISLHSHALYFEDAEQVISWEEVQSLSAEDTIYQQLKAPITNFNFTTSRFWVRFELVNETAKHQSFFLETGRPLTNVVNLYCKDETGEIQVFNNGDGQVFNQRFIKDRRVLFPIELSPGARAEYWVELISDGEIITLPLLLWPKRTYLAQNGREALFHGVYYGVLLLVLVLFTFFFIAMGERVFLYYVLYVFCLSFFQFSLDGYSFRYLWPNLVWWGNHALLFTTSIAVISVLIYARAFLTLCKNLPGINRVFQLLIALTAVVALMSLTDGVLYELAFPLINFLSLISTVTILITVLIAMYKRLKVSIFFSLAFLALMLGGIYFILGNVNIIENTPITENAIKFGSALEVILLSIAMAGRYRDLQLEKEKAQQTALEKLEEMNRLKDRLNIELEQQVQERTSVVERQNKALAEINKDITDSIRYAKRIQMAILPSQLTVESHLPDSFILYRPKDIVSGDFYWLRATPETVLFSAVDCTGHGVPGAFMSIVGQNGLNQAVDEYHLRQPGEILEHLNQVVALTLKQREADTQVRDGMDIALCGLNYAKRLLEYSGAYNPLWIVSQTPPLVNGLPLEPYARISSENLSFYEIKADKQPIGAYVDRKHKQFTNHQIQLHSGDTFYIFTDGYADQFGGPKGKKFKYLPLKRLLMELSSQTMAEQQKSLSEAFDSWKGDLDQVDDVCMLGVRVP